MVDQANAVDILKSRHTEAFDKVPHGVLVEKLVKCRMDKVTVRWLCSWLTDIHEAA